MSRPQSPIVCDGPGCGKQKQEANHWWVIGVAKRSAFRQQPVLILCSSTPDVSYDLAPEMTFDERYTLLDFCGQTCALKFISEQMGKAGEQNAK